MAGPTVLVRWITDASGLKKGVDDADKSTNSFKSNLVKVGAAIGTAFAVKKVVDFAKDSVAAAQDLNANMSRTTTIFGDSADAVMDWSSKSAKYLRVSQAEALGAANAVGKTLVGSFDMSGEAAAEMSIGVVALARDMAAFNRVPFQEALDKVTAGMNGQTRGLKTLGVSMDAAEIKTFALKMGFLKQGQAMTPAIKAQATFELLLEKTMMQQGATEKGANSLKGQQERLSAEWKNAQATLGQQLLPVITELAQIFTQVVIPAIGLAASVFKALGPAMMPVVVALGVLAAGIKIATIAQNLFNISLLGNPITWIVIGIVALVAAIVVLATKTQFFQKIWDTMTKAATSAINWVRDAVVAVFNWVSRNWPLLAAILLGPIALAVYAIVRNFDTIRAGIEAVFGWFRDLGGRVYNAIVSGFNAVVSWFGALGSKVLGGITSGFAAVLSFFSGLPGRIMSSLGSINLFQAGYNILASLGRGIMSAAQGVLDQVSGIAGKIKGLWPFSPAEWGPFRQYPPERSGRKLVDLWAQGIAAGERSLETTAARVAGVAAMEPAALAGAGGPVVSQTAAGAPGGPAVIIQNATFTDEADIDVFLRRVSWAAATGSI